MAHVNKGSHSFTCHPHVYPQAEWAVPAFIPQPHSITAFWLVFISHPAECRRLSWPGWHGEILRWFVCQKTVTHPSTSRRGRESNSRPPNCESNGISTRLTSQPVSQSIIYIHQAQQNTNDTENIKIQHARATDIHHYQQQSTASSKLPHIYRA